MISYFNEKDLDKLVVNFISGGKEFNYTILGSDVLGIDEVDKFTMYHSDIFRQKFTFKTRLDKSKAVNHLVGSIKDYWMYVNQKR
ncbi:MAG: hypothetical protein ACK5B9_11540 [Flavobacteriia bacterium]